MRYCELFRADGELIFCFIGLIVFNSVVHGCNLNCVPCLSQIAVGECYRVRFRSVHSRAFVRNLYVSCLYKELGSFLFGCCVGQSLTNMAKLSVGRLRPHFLSACNVTYASLNCLPGAYISDVVCSNKPKIVEEARYVDYKCLFFWEAQR